jgi:hypothetical protein
MLFKPFTAVLNRTLEKDSYALPLSEENETRLLAQLPEGEETLLVIRDGLYSEEIRVVSDSGYIRIAERGVGETEPRKFPRGSCLCFEVTLSVVREEICHYDCCAEGDCACLPAEAAGRVLPPATAGQPWEGSVIFKGDLPMVMGAGALPAWMQAETGPNYLRLYGTPSGIGVYSIAVAASN